MSPQRSLHTREQAARKPSLPLTLGSGHSTWRAEQHRDFVPQRTASPQARRESASSLGATLTGAADPPEGRWSGGGANAGPARTAGRTTEDTGRVSKPAEAPEGQARARTAPLFPDIPNPPSAPDASHLLGFPYWPTPAGKGSPRQLLTNFSS